MATFKTCDLCEKVLMESFNSSSYKVTVKKLSHFYDGYAPWVGKAKVDFCEDCAFALIDISMKLDKPKRRKK